MAGGPAILSKGDRRSKCCTFHKSQIARQAAAIEIREDITSAQEDELELIYWTYPSEASRFSR